MSKGPPGEVCASLPNAQVQPLDEGSVELLGILRAEEHLLQPFLRSDHQLPLHPGHPVTAPRLDDLTVHAGMTQKLPEDTAVVVEAIAGHQRKLPEPAPLQHIARQLFCASVAAASDHG